MSYDMMVFEASAAPREATAFIAWFEKQTQWNERHEYDDPAVSSPALQAWFTEMAQDFPPLNGPLSNDDDDRAGRQRRIFGEVRIDSGCPQRVCRRPHPVGIGRSGLGNRAVHRNLKLASAGRALVTTHYDWSAIMPAFARSLAS